MAGREKPINWERVDELLISGCLGTEIASVFDMHHDTFYRRVEEKYGISFTAYSCQKRQTGDTLLREAQFKKALANDTSMMIWLGKNRLGQRDAEKVEKDVNAADIHQLLAFINKFNTATSEASKSGQSPVETSESVLDKGQERKPSEVCSELGSEGAAC